MIVRFIPLRRDEALSLERTSPDRLRINGELFNFGPLQDGDTIPAGEIPCEWIVGPVERIDGEIHITVILPHGPNPSRGVAFPEPITVAQDGPIAVPHDRVAYETVPAEGGIIHRTKHYLWGQEPDVWDEFVPDPEPEPASQEEQDHE